MALRLPIVDLKKWGISFNSSFAALLEYPDGAWAKDATLNRYRKTMNGERMMGKSLRTDRYRLVEWVFLQQEKSSMELSDHRYDPDEHVNIAGYPEQQSIVNFLSEQLHKVWENR